MDLLGRIQLLVCGRPQRAFTALTRYVLAWLRPTATTTCCGSSRKDLTARALGGDKRGGAVEGGIPILHPPRYAPRDVALRGRLLEEHTILNLPAALEDLLEYLEPDFLGYDATLHSNRCYTIILLSLDYKYRAYRAHLSDDNRWSINPLDWSGTFRLVQPPEGETW